MDSRRNFLKATAALTFTSSAARLAARAGVAQGSPANEAAGGQGERAYWCTVASRLAHPILTALAERQLKAVMPVEARHPAERAPYTHLEAVGRLLAGLAPWLELPGDDLAEGRQRDAMAEQARNGIDAITRPGSPDFIDFTRRGQTLVDAAFLGQALLRAPTRLWEPLPATVKSNVLAALAATRGTRPGESNWVLFASMVEAALLQFGGKIDAARLQHGLEQHEKWYVGDGLYGDGP